MGGQADTCYIITKTMDLIIHTIFTKSNALSIS